MLLNYGYEKYNYVRPKKIINNLTFNEQLKICNENEKSYTNRNIYFKPSNPIRRNNLFNQNYYGIMKERKLKFAYLVITFQRHAVVIKN